MSVARAPAELVLGTAQLGLAYGIANRVGLPDRNDARLILRSAVSAGVSWIDTAASYGESERRIGEALPGPRRAYVVTKLSPLDELDVDTSPGKVRQAVCDSVRRSCARLGTDRLEVLLLHRARHLSWRGGMVWDIVKELRDEGILYDLGVSVYDPEEALEALSDPNVRHIQLPMNVLDWRWREHEVDKALTSRPDVRVHARSALLQGLLTANAGLHWPSGYDGRKMPKVLHLLSLELERDGPADLCLAYVRAQPWIAGVVVGMESLRQLALNLALFRRPPLTPAEVCEVERSLPRLSQCVLNPALWSKAA